MNKCVTCKWYEPLTQAAPDGVAMYGHCSRWHSGYHVAGSDVKDNEAWVEDDEGWGNVVGPQFGCVLHEAKQ